MAPPTLPGPDETQDDAQWRTAGERIQTLLDASAAGGAVARERAEQLVREVTDLYGAVLERMMDVALAADPNLADRFAADDLVASLQEGQPAWKRLSSVQRVIEGDEQVRCPPG